ncbi:histidinol dehydrogenase [Candidatus Bathyarchaeota archaeon]|nr:histidinol dehydrogenase [Candidatus Bathyarchaeota archaeon]
MGDQQLEVKVWKSVSLPKDWLRRRERTPQENSQLFEENVRKIINGVKKSGDAALVEFTERFDKTKLRPEQLQVSSDEIEEAYGEVNQQQIGAIKFIKEKTTSFEKLIFEKQHLETTKDGIVVQNALRPIESVGCYVPGGRAAYPSTVVMTTVPAKVAGVPRIAVCSPPSAEGAINPLILVAADICGVDEVYRIGGAQAIAALAYGTERIKPVRKIVGPGNKYVTAAKRLVSKEVAIDMPAGPSEVLILADEAANPRFIARDMISQAEHGVDSIPGLITTSEKIAEEVLYWLKDMVVRVERGIMVRKALNEYGFIIICDNNDEMIANANRFAAEHVEIMTQTPMEIAKRITSAGEILIGSYSPVSLSDYGSGANHVLPTGGFCRVFSGLSVLDFAKRISIIKGSREGLKKLEGYVRVLTEAENLPNHYKAIAERIQIEGSKKKMA